MPPLRPETRWSATLIQTFSVVATLCAAGWYVRGTYEEVLQGQIEIKRQIAEIRESLDTQYVTHEQADRYASAFRWENRSITISVPDPKGFQ